MTKKTNKVVINLILFFFVSFLFFSNQITVQADEVVTEEVEVQNWYDTIKRGEAGDNSEPVTTKITRKDLSEIQGAKDKVEEVAQRIAQILTALGFGIATIVVAYAGYEYTVSSGNPEKAYMAKLKILYAMIGLTIVMLASTLIEIASQVMGLS